MKQWYHACLLTFLPFRPSSRGLSRQFFQEISAPNSSIILFFHRIDIYFQRVRIWICSDEPKIRSLPSSSFPSHRPCGAPRLPSSPSPHLRSSPIHSETQAMFFSSTKHIHIHYKLNLCKHYPQSVWIQGWILFWQHFMMPHSQPFFSSMKQKRKFVLDEEAMANPLCHDEVHLLHATSTATSYLWGQQIKCPLKISVDNK